MSGASKLTVCLTRRSPSALGKSHSAGLWRWRLRGVPVRADLRHDQFLSGSGLTQIRLLHQVTNIFLGEGSGVGDRGSGDGSCYRVDGLEFEAQVRKGRRCFESSSELEQSGANRFGSA